MHNSTLSLDPSAPGYPHVGCKHPPFVTGQDCCGHASAQGFSPHLGSSLFGCVLVLAESAHWIWQGGSHYWGALVPNKAAHQVWWDRSYFGGMLVRVDPQGNSKVSVASKTDGDIPA